MSETVDDFKNFFKPNTLKREFSVEEVINQTIKILNASLKKYQIEIEIDIRENFTIFANFNEIIQILINIINNAKDAGSGLGLYMSRLIASKNNALIFARNVDENSITFTISFENL